MNFPIFNYNLSTIKCFSEKSSSRVKATSSAPTRPKKPKARSSPSPTSSLFPTLLDLLHSGSRKILRSSSLLASPKTNPKSQSTSSFPSSTKSPSQSKATAPSTSPVSLNPTNRATCSGRRRSRARMKMRRARKSNLHPKLPLSRTRLLPLRRLPHPSRNLNRLNRSLRSLRRLHLRWSLLLLRRVMRILMTRTLIRTNSMNSSKKMTNSKKTMGKMKKNKNPLPKPLQKPQEKPQAQGQGKSFSQQGGHLGGHQGGHRGGHQGGHQGGKPFNK